MYITKIQKHPICSNHFVNSRCFIFAIRFVQQQASTQGNQKQGNQTASVGGNQNSGATGSTYPLVMQLAAVQLLMLADLLSDRLVATDTTKISTLSNMSKITNNFIFSLAQ
jgi:hypothetical protein